MSADPNRHPAKVCGTCLKVLDYIEDGDGTGGRYCHVQEEYGKRTHVAIPVDPSEVEHVASHCDFCYTDQGGDVWTVVAHPFELELLTADGVTGQEFSSLWAACNDCATLVRRGRWKQLVARVVKEQARRHNLGPQERSFRKAAIGSLYSRLEANYITVRASRPDDLSETDYLPR